MLTEVYFIFNLYSLPLSSPPGKPFVPKGKLFGQVISQFPNSPPPLDTSAITLVIFSHASPTKKSLPNSYHHTLDKEKSFVFPGTIFSKICFSQKQKGAEATMIYFMKTKSQHMKMTWKIRVLIFCMICNFFKCHGSIVLQIISIL